MKRFPIVLLAVGLLALAFLFPPVERVIEPLPYELAQGKRTPTLVNQGMIFIGNMPTNGRIIMPQWTVHLAVAAFVAGLGVWWGRKPVGN